MADQTQKPGLWTTRSVQETQKIYADWADTYEADVKAMAYATPTRLAQALLAIGADPTYPTLDFGCGTGLSGVALAAAGFTTIDGTDITPEMLDHARAKDTYRRLWLGTPGDVEIDTGAYPTIVATGVISLGAAPPDMLDVLLNKLTSGGLLAFSYNDPTLADASYMDTLARALDDGRAEQVFRQHGPHLSEKVTGSDVIILRRL